MDGRIGLVSLEMPSSVFPARDIQSRGLRKKRKPSSEIGESVKKAARELLGTDFRKYAFRSTSEK